MTAAAERLRARVSEAELRAMVIETARLAGWHCYSIHDSRRQTWSTDTGFPDVFLLRGPKALALELKAERGRVSTQQQSWLFALQAAGIEARVVRPADYPALRAELLAPATLKGGA